jgi:hypothetical protein
MPVLQHLIFLHELVVGGDLIPIPSDKAQQANKFHPQYIAILYDQRPLSGRKSTESTRRNSFHIAQSAKCTARTTCKIAKKRYYLPLCILAYQG